LFDDEVDDDDVVDVGDFSVRVGTARKLAAFSPGLFGLAADASWFIGDDRGEGVAFLSRVL